LRNVLLTRPEGAGRLHIALVGGQHDDASLGEFAKNGVDGIQAAHVGHLQIHQRDVGSMLAE
jgi:hypothetical protein